MPTVVRDGANRYFFYSNENAEPPHIHIQAGRSIAKFWLDPVTLAQSRHYSAVELNRIADYITANRTLFLEAWNEHFKH